MQSFRPCSATKASVFAVQCERLISATGRRRAGVPGWGGARGSLLRLILRAFRRCCPCRSGGRGRGINHACNRHAVSDQGDIDGKIILAGNEFLGPIQRIDQKNSVPVSGRMPFETASSAMTGIWGKCAASACRMITSARWSASVTGEQSSLYDTCGPARWTAMIACPASSAAFVNMSIILLPLPFRAGDPLPSISLLFCPPPVKQCVRQH